MLDQRHDESSMENYNLLSGVEQMEKKRGERLQEIVTKRHEIQATAKQIL